MFERETYNGWSNRETWLTNLWLTNEGHGYAVLMEAVSLQCPAVDKAEWLRSQLEEQLDIEVVAPCLWRDLLQHAFRRVDWLEIVKGSLE
jgi:hypothetical protein